MEIIIKGDAQEIAKFVEKLQSWNKNCSGWYRKPYTDEWVRCNTELSFTASAHESIPSKRD